MNSSSISEDVLLAIRARSLRDSFTKFIKAMWREVSGFDIVWGPHLDILAQHCEGLFRGEITRCLWNVPPSCSKSTVLVLFEAWVFANDPTSEFLCVSYSQDLALRDSVRCRELLRSSAYQELFPYVQISADDDSKSFFRLTAGGSRRVSSPDSVATGLHFDYFIFDDPQSVNQASSVADREKLLGYYWQAISTRGIASNRKGGSRHLVAQQRLRVDDISSSIIERHEQLVRDFGPSGSPWHIVVLPMRYEASSAMQDRGYGSDWRTVEGELLYAALLPEEKVVAVERELGPIAAAAQLQQRPIRYGSGMVKVDQIKIIKESELPSRFDAITRFYDLAGSDNSGCYTVGLLLGKLDAKFFILHVLRDRWELAEAIRQIGVQAYIDRSLYGDLVKTGFEEQGGAAGKFLTSEIQKRLRDIRTFSVRPMGSKEARMEPVATSIGYGEFSAVDAKWLPPLLDELTLFPHSKYLDQGDALSGAYQSIVSTKGSSGGGMVLPALASVRDPSSWEVPKCLNPQCKRPAFGIGSSKEYCCSCCEIAHEWEEEVDKHLPDCALKFNDWYVRHSPVERDRPSGFRGTYRKRF